MGLDDSCMKIRSTIPSRYPLLDLRPQTSGNFARPPNVIRLTNSGNMRPSGVPTLVVARDNKFVVAFGESKCYALPQALREIKLEMKWRIIRVRTIFHINDEVHTSQDHALKIPDEIFEKYDQINISMIRMWKDDHEI
nr:hypothetical protein [Tanacetum cinerariifolium]